jgi:thiamine transport system substrate-binding protein
LEQLTLPQYRDQLVVSDPATSSPGLAFLFATIAAFGSEWPDYWESLKENGVRVVSDWDTAYYGESTWWGGDRPLVLSYASSPPAEVIFAEEPLTEAPTGVIDETCYRQIEFAGVLSGTDHPDEAKALVDYMLSPEFQEQIPLAWFVFPANESAALPQEFIDHTTVPAAPASLEPDEIEANRELWIEQWTSIMVP